MRQPNLVTIVAGDYADQPQAFLSKPFAQEELITAISKALAKEEG